MADEPLAATVLELAAELTAAWLSNPSTKISAEELPGVIKQIHGALAGLTNAPAATEAAPEYVGAVSVRRSLASKDHIISMIDGKPYRMLKRHLAGNGLTPDQQRERYGLKPDYPMVAETYSAHRSEMAKKIGLGRQAGQVAAAKPAAAKASPAKAAKVAPANPPPPEAKPAAKKPAKPAAKTATKPAVKADAKPARSAAAKAAKPKPKAKAAPSNTAPAAS